jgi:hypothetical protein
MSDTLSGNRRSLPVSTEGICITCPSPVCAPLRPLMAPQAPPGLTCVSATPPFPLPRSPLLQSIMRNTSATPLAPCDVVRAFHAVDSQQLFELRPCECYRAPLHSLSTYPGSKCFDTLPAVPSLRLDDQSFQDNARIRLGIRNFTTMSQAWRCTCGQLVDGDDVAHALGRECR